MSARYAKRINSGPYGKNKTITLGSAQEAPKLVDQCESKKIDEIMIENYDGGMSFSYIDTFNQAVIDKNTHLANKMLENIVLQLAIFGTSDTRADISANELTEQSAA